MDATGSYGIKLASKIQVRVCWSSTQASKDDVKSIAFRLGCEHRKSSRNNEQHNLPTCALLVSDLLYDFARILLADTASALPAIILV
ncbi:uncharacterized protein TrAtP1_001667 [Trichoderma atroviride]|uniref:uncharacterized protein n=1 Tax=Hypocrea atroviridis TaxID=63577 RepID=UPI0033333416|nr:hypothetical protein TrAtP1_001667 [Trichoderma atroviride]